MKAVAVLHDLAGAPAIDGCADQPGRCAICGISSQRTTPYSRWQGANFTDQNKLTSPGAESVCESCVWGHSWVAPPGHEVDPDKARGPNLRMYTHLWSESDGYWYGNKGDKAHMREWLLATRRERWFAAIADSGQKHVLPWTPVNPGWPGRARFEESTVLVDARLADLTIAICELMTRGATEAEIDRGEYHVRRWMEIREAIQRFERRWSGDRGGSQWALAVWLAQPEDT